MDRWHATIGDPTYADAILDRLVHNAIRLPLKGKSLREPETDAGISYALTEALNDGHCGLPVQELLVLAEKLLEVPVTLIETAIGLELGEQTIGRDTVETTDCIFLAGLYQAEKAIAERILRLAAGKPSWPRIDARHPRARPSRGVHASLASIAPPVHCRAMDSRNP